MKRYKWIAAAIVVMMAQPALADEQTHRQEAETLYKEFAAPRMTSSWWQGVIAHAEKQQNPPCANVIQPIINDGMLRIVMQYVSHPSYKETLVKAYMKAIPEQDLNKMNGFVRSSKGMTLPEAFEKKNASKPLQQRFTQAANVEASLARRLLDTRVRESAWLKQEVETALKKAVDEGRCQ